MYSPFCSHNTYLLQGYVPNSSDILCGRGQTNGKHPGNIMFLRLIRSSLKDYTNAKSRIEKSVVVTSVVSNIGNAGMRFLKLDVHCNQYMELSSESAHEKVGHAIRDSLRQENKKKARNKGSTASAPTRDDKFKSPRPDKILSAVSPGTPAHSNSDKYVATRKAFSVSTNKKERKRSLTYFTWVPQEHQDCHCQQRSTLQNTMDDCSKQGATLEGIGETTTNLVDKNLQFLLSALSENIISSSSKGTNEKEDDPLPIFSDFECTIFTDQDVPTDSINQKRNQEINCDVDVCPLPIYSDVSFKSLDVDGLSDVLGTGST